MRELKAAFICAGWNLYSLRKDVRFYMSLLLGLLLCWLLTEKTLAISRTYMTDLQLLEPFIWCYADDDSILFAALTLMLMLSALPRLDAPASYMIFRAGRASWLAGQMLTVFILTLGHSLMILFSSMAMCIGCNVFAADHWSETATMLSFAPGSFEVAINVMRNTVKLAEPYSCAVQIFLLLFQYVLLTAMIQLTFAVLKSRKAGIMAALIVNFAGYVLTPDSFMTWLQLPQSLSYYANLISAWISPLRHATYTMHNFGYDLLPTLPVSHIMLSGATLVLSAAAALSMRRFQFNFTGGYADE